MTKLNRKTVREADAEAETERDARRIFELVRERGAQREIDLAAQGIPLARQLACAPRVAQLLEAAGLAA